MTDDPFRVPDGRSGDASSRSPRLTWVLSAVAVVLAVAAVAVWTLGHSDDGADGRSMAAGLSVILDEADYVAGVASPEDCPVTDVQRVAAHVRDVLDDATALADATASSTVYEETGDFPAGAFCNLYLTDAVDRVPSAMSLSVTITPLGAYDDFLRSTFAPSSTVLGKVADADGGVVHPYCVVASSEDGQTGCGADWIDDDAEVVVGVYLENVRNQETAVTLLDRVLPLVEESMAAKRPA